jgi:hypothetical protein
VSASSSWEQYEKEVEQRNRRLEARRQLEEERNPKRSIIHSFFRMISFMTGCSAFLMGLGQIIGMTYNHIDTISYVLRSYVIALCFLVVMVEAEWTSFVRNSSILRYWITRGLFYSFVGIIGIQQNDHVEERNPSESRRDSASLKFIRVVAWLMVASGVVYFMVGILCMQIIYNRLRRDYEERCKRAVHIRNATDRLVEANEV